MNITTHSHTHRPGRLPHWPLYMAAVCLALLTTACTSLRVGSDYDRVARFTDYHTYTWLARPHYATVNPLLVKRAHDAIDAELMSRGYTLVEDPSRADFIVNFTVGTHDRQDVQSYPTSFRAPWRWGLGYYGEQIDVRQYREGTLAIDIFDGRTHQPVWTGWLSEQISSNDRSRSEPALRASAAAVLGKFPPQ